MLNKRRMFLQHLLALPVLAATPVQAKTQAQIRYLSASANRAGQYFINGLDENAQTRFSLTLPSRGHAVTLSPNGQQAVAVARRPGDYLLVFDTQTGEVLHRLTSQADRHFYGHAVFSADGRWLYTTENDFASGQGMIGVRNAHQAFRQTGEFPSYGVGPHELAMLSDGKTLVIANGGIQTHPDTGRAKLNLATMQPSLAYIDRQTGQLSEKHVLSPDLHQNSIRHLTLAADDQICFVMQYQGKRTATPPLIGLHRRGEKIRLLTAPDILQKRMRNYCGSVSVDNSGQIFAVSSPRGGLVSFWHTDHSDYLGHVDMPDVCGLASGSTAGEFLLSSGDGSMLRYQVSNKTTENLLNRNLAARWDNHMLSIKR